MKKQQLPFGLCKMFVKVFDVAKPVNTVWQADLLANVFKTVQPMNIVLHEQSFKNQDLSLWRIIA